MTRHVSLERWLLQKMGRRADIKQYLDEDKIAEEGCSMMGSMQYARIF